MVGAYWQAGNWTGLLKLLLVACVPILFLAVGCNSGISLTVITAGTGSGAVISNPAGIDCGRDCSATYARGTALTLMAIPNTTSIFSGWSGACTGTGPCTVAMDALHLVTATFSHLPAVFPLLDPRFAYAVRRHWGETRVGTIYIVNKRLESDAAIKPVCEGTGEDTQCRLRFAYAFRHQDREEYVGVSLSLGRIGITPVSRDDSHCTPGSPLDLHQDSTFNLTDWMLNAKDQGTSIEFLRLVLCPDGRPQALTLRVELEDQHGQKMFTRVPFDSRGTRCRPLDVPLSSFLGSIDRTAVKSVSILTEEWHAEDRITNPPQGGFDIQFVGFVDRDGPRRDAGFIASLSDREMVAELARRDFESLLRLTDAKTGASLDRTLFRDLIHWGATGWLLASLPAAVKHGWITGDEARVRALQVLRFLDTDNLWGDDPVGKVGNSRGMMYRYGGIDPDGLFGPRTGTRKLNAGDCNAVEASVFDTALFQFGAATLAAGFDTADPRDQEIAERVRNLLNRTRWDELVDPNSGQLQLGWKLERDDTPGCFTAPAPSPFRGFWASRDKPPGKCPEPTHAEALTIDYWTDEGAMAAVLAVGSATHPASSDTWYRMSRTFGRGVGANVIVTFPGSWFTYTFYTATYLDPTVGPDRGHSCSATISADWTENAVKAFSAYQRLSPPGELVLPDAVELPDTSYLNQGKPEVAADREAIFAGTRTPWSVQLALGLGGQTTTDAIAELRRLLVEQPEHWDPLFGLVDSYHPNLADFIRAFPSLGSWTAIIRTWLTSFARSLGMQHAEWRRTEGRWVQQQVWPLNKGPALLAQLNYLDDGIVWRTANKYPVIQRGIERIYTSRCTNAPPSPR